MFKKLNKNLISILFILFILYIVNRNSTHILYDDVLLELCYSGYFSGGIPVSDHLFQHFFLTQIFSCLYTYFNFCNWYFYLHLIFLGLSFFTILHVLKNNKNKYYMLILVVILFFIEYIYFTYTRISFYVAFSGFLFLLKHNRLDRYKLIYSTSMVFLGAMIRPEGAILALIVFILLYLCSENLKNKFYEFSVKKQFILIISIPLIVLVTHKISNIENSKRFPLRYISESTHYDYSSFNNKMMDSNDVKRLKNFYIDERFTSKEVVNYVKYKVQKHNLKTRFNFSIAILNHVFHQGMYQFLFFILILQILLINGYVNKIKFLAVILFLFSALIFGNTFYDIPFYKHRVMEPILFSLIIAFYVKDSTYNFKFDIVIEFMILLTFIYVLKRVIWKDEYVEQNEAVNTKINKVFDSIPENEFVFDAVLFTYLGYFPGHFRVEESKHYENHRILPLSWAQASYSSKALYSKIGVNRMDEILVKPNTTLLLDSTQLSLWKNYGQKYLNKNLVPYDTIYVDSNQSCFYIARYKTGLKID